MINLEKAKSLQKLFLDLSYPHGLHGGFSSFSVALYLSISLSVFPLVFFTYFLWYLEMIWSLVVSYRETTKQFWLLLCLINICWRNLHAKYRFTVSFQSFYNIILIIIHIFIFKYMHQFFSQICKLEKSIFYNSV